MAENLNYHREKVSFSWAVVDRLSYADLHGSPRHNRLVRFANVVFQQLQLKTESILGSMFAL